MFVDTQTEQGFKDVFFGLYNILFVHFKQFFAQDAQYIFGI